MRTVWIWYLHCRDKYSFRTMKAVRANAGRFTRPLSRVSAAYFVERAEPDYLHVSENGINIVRFR